MYQEKLACVPAIVAGTLGSASGMTVSYALGRWLGPGLVERVGRVMELDAARLDASRAWYLRWGKLSVFFGYFVPGLRHVAAFAAGSSGLAWAPFAALGYSGGLVWAASMVTLGYAFGAEWAHSSARFHRILLGGFVIAAVGLAVVVVVRRRRRGGTPAGADERQRPGHDQSARVSLGATRSRIFSKAGRRGA